MKTCALKSLQAVSILTLAIAFQAHGAVPHSFAAGEPARAAEVNENFDSIDQRLTTLESNAESFTESATYPMPFSALGAPKNVVVQKAVDQNTNTIFYVVRVRYQNQDEEISVVGIPYKPPYIASYGFVTVQSDGTVLEVRNNIEAPQTTDYKDYYIERSYFDLTSGAPLKIVLDDTLRVSQSCYGSGGTRVCLDTTLSSADGSYLSTTSFAQVRTYADTFALPSTGAVFDDVRIEYYPHARWVRVRAAGIGEIFRQQNGVVPPERPAIYYRIDGVGTWGSLEGTPFAPDGSLHGLFF